MCAQQSTTFRNKGNNKNNSKPDDLIDFREVFSKYLFHWPLYLLLVAICCGAGLVYLKLVKPGYEGKASLVMEDNKENKPSPNGDLLKELDVAGPPKIVE